MDLHANIAEDRLSDSGDQSQDESGKEAKDGAITPNENKQQDEMLDEARDSSDKEDDGSGLEDEKEDMKSSADSSSSSSESEEEDVEEEEEPPSDPPEVNTKPEDEEREVEALEEPREELGLPEKEQDPSNEGKDADTDVNEKDAPETKDEDEDSGDDSRDEKEDYPESDKEQNDGNPEGKEDPEPQIQEESPPEPPTNKPNHDPHQSDEEKQPSEESPIKEEEDTPQDDPLHGNNYDSDSSSSSSSDDEDSGPLVIRQQPEEKPQDGDDEDLAQCLKRALEEREKQQQVEKPSHGPMQDFDPDANIDDSSLKARSAEDFQEDQPPALPPKMRGKSNTGPKSDLILPNILHVNDKTASLGRGRWSDDDELSPSVPPPAYRQQKKEPARHLPDRIVDFSQPQTRPSSKPNKSRHGNHPHQHYDPPTRIINVPKHPKENINDVYRRQAMVSLHSNAPNDFNSDDSDQFDRNPEDINDLNRLIKEANSLDLHAQPEKKPDPVDVVYPSYNKSLPRQKNLASAYPEVFAKLANNDDHVVPVVPVVEPVQFSAIPQGPDLSIKRNSQQRRRKSVPNEDPLPTTRDPLDGDDEISIGESEIKFPTLPSDIPKSLDASQYLCEVYPSDYTDFDSETDATEIPQGDPLHHDITPYDTVADLETDIDMPKPRLDSRLNPIVNEDYRICTLSKSHNTFPRRVRQDKPVPKERASLNAIAIPLTDPSSGPKRRMASLPYEKSAPLRRNKSVPDFEKEPQALFGQVPQIVVTRGPTGSDGDFPGPASYPRDEEPTNKKIRRTESDGNAPHFHFSVGATTNSDTDATVVGSPNNNLQINVLPSDDPNVINLNITAASRAPSSDDAMSPVLFDEPPTFSPLQVQPIVPMTAISHPPPPITETDLSPLTSPQHRVVEMPSVLVDTSDLPPPPQQEPEPEVETIPKQHLVPEVIIAPPQPFQPVQIAQPIVHQPIEPVLVPVQANAPPMQPTITTTRSMIVQPAVERNQPNNTVVEIQPLQDGRYRSLPAGHEKMLRHGGDSGIDLTNYDTQRRGGEEEDSDSSSDSEYDMQSTNSKRKLKKSDELNGGGLSDKYIEWYKRQYMKPTCCYLFTKHLMFVLNLIFLLIGLALIGLGLWGIIDMMTSGKTDVWLVLYDPIFPVFVLGVVITLVCFVGAVGFLRDNICLLKCFGSFLVILCLCFVGGGITFWIMKITIQEFTTNSFVNLIGEYNYTTRKAASFTIDQIQANFECCGFNTYRDWNNTAEYRCYDGQTCNLPPTCCKISGPTVPCTTISGSRNNLGCINGMSLWARNKTPLLVGVWLGIIVLFFINFGCIYAMKKEIKYLHRVRDKIFTIGENYSDAESRVIFNGNTRSEFELPSQY